MSNLSSKQRAYLRGLGNSLEPIFQIGKSGVTPDVTTAVDDALKARELIKVAVLKNCDDDPRIIADTLAGRTRSSVVQVIGRKFILYRANRDDPKIVI